MAGSNSSIAAAGQNAAQNAAPISAEGLKLLRAAGGGEEAQVGSLLRLNLVVDQQYSTESDKSAVRSLLVDLSTEIEQFTALHVAAIAGHVKVVDMILLAISSLGFSENEKKSILNCRDFMGRTPLHHAAWMHHGGVMKALLSCQEVYVNPEDNDKFTPLHLVLMTSKGESDAETRKQLLGHPDTKLDSEATQSDKTRTFLNSPQLRVDCWRKDLPLSHLFPKLSDYVLDDSMKGPITPMQRIIPNNLQESQTDSESVSLRVLESVWGFGNVGVEREIVKEIERQLRPIVKSRLQEEHSDHDMSTFSWMHLSAYLGLSRLMKILAKNSELFLACINAETCDDQTPLHLAALAGNLHMVRYLNEQPTLRGDVEDKLSQTAVELAKEIQLDSIVKILMQRKDVKDYVGMVHADRSVYVDGTNSILVGAALIASITFAGWLQPPLGYQSAPNENYMQYAAIQYHTSLKVFWIFNSLSFYFAIAAILTGAATVVPRSDQFVRAEVKRLGGALYLTSFVFSWAVVFVVVAFTAAGFASLPPILQYQMYMVVTLLVGLFACFSTFAIARSSNPRFYITYTEYIDPGYYFSKSLSGLFSFCVPSGYKSAKARAQGRKHHYLKSRPAGQSPGRN